MAWEAPLQVGMRLLHPLLLPAYQPQGESLTRHAPPAPQEQLQGAGHAAADSLDVTGQIAAPCGAAESLPLAHSHRLAAAAAAPASRDVPHAISEAVPSSAGAQIAEAAQWISARHAASPVAQLNAGAQQLASPDGLEDTLGQNQGPRLEVSPILRTKDPEAGLMTSPADAMPTPKHTSLRPGKGQSPSKRLLSATADGTVTQGSSQEGFLLKGDFRARPDRRTQHHPDLAAGTSAVPTDHDPDGACKVLPQPRSGDHMLPRLSPSKGPASDVGNAEGGSGKRRASQAPGSTHPKRVKASPLDLEGRYAELDKVDSVDSDIDIFQPAATQRSNVRSTSLSIEVPRDECQLRARSRPVQLAKAHTPPKGSAGHGEARLPQHSNPHTATLSRDSPSHKRQPRSSQTEQHGTSPTPMKGAQGHQSSGPEEARLPRDMAPCRRNAGASARFAAAARYGSEPMGLGNCFPA